MGKRIGLVFIIGGSIFMGMFPGLIKSKIKEVFKK